MNAAKHTPGEWSFQQSATRDGFIVEGETLDGNGQNYLVAVVGNINGNSRNEANARLIAAAPELLEALEAAVNNATGLAAYLATCATSTILENLETTIAGLHKEAEAYRTAISKARGTK